MSIKKTVAAFVSILVMISTMSIFTMNCLAATTLVDDFTSITPPAGATYNNFAKDYKTQFSLATQWTIVDPNVVLDETVLDLKDGSKSPATAVYDFKGVTKATIVFYMSGANFASKYSWGYSRGWEYMVGSSYKDAWGKQLNAGDILPIDLKKISKVYRDVKNDKLYTKFISEKDSWGWYIGDPRYGFALCDKPSAKLQNYGMTCEYSKDKGKTWTAVDYNIVSVIGAKDPMVSSAKEPWYQETCTASFPSGVTHIRIGIDDVKISYGGSNGEDMRVITNRNWAICLANVKLEGTGPIGTNATTAPQSTSDSTGLTTSPSTSSSTSTSSETISESNSRQVTSLTSPTVPVNGEKSNSSKGNGIVILIVCVALALTVVNVLMFIPKIRRLFIKK